MSGITDLTRLLKELSPQLDPQRYVYACMPDTPENWLQLCQSQPLAVMREQEGLTAVLSLQQASALNVDGSNPLRRITLTVHSSLEAVGLTAAVARALAAQGISANMLAAFYHDHVMVADKDAQAAMRCLAELSTTR
ncbi:ACT domain-containing protein [Aestuariibacter halophilus]|uniref:ACT domain-containing protein n=1 Tax=Fluctibacter halophilus TaxID=226011 RepID=A0ABS8G451_9ALTE|nr:ACT domain-containing protein [Aestuariibacter halophilus]MCC2615274.1 ACT domain-containing protein [Aestuariibacter halophilus]